ncbi:MAG: hypothetical protein JWN15_1775 [Firmicutes bacterium]|nr:hypothetical protein [Bacillota bacterium]
MDPILLQHLRQAFAAQAAQCREISPLGAALCEGLGAAPGQGVIDIFSRFFRITAVVTPNPALMIAGLHHLALGGGAPELARFFPSCGGTYGDTDRAALVAAAEGALAASPEEILDFMLSWQPQRPEVRRSSAFVLGALAVTERFGGGLSVVEAGAGAGLNLWFDRYAYQFGDGPGLGESPLHLAIAVADRDGAVRRLLDRGVPTVVARVGLDQEPGDLTDPDQRQAREAFFWPDELAALERLRAAAALVPTFGAAEIRSGAVEHDLAALLMETYNAMPEGNTLFLCESLLWPYLSEQQRVRMTSAIQQLAAQLRPYKPLAWLQVEPFTQGSATLSLRLHTFGWADQEDRAVRNLAEAAPDLAWVRWLE